MNVSELYQLTTWIIENNEDSVFERQYQELINAISNGGVFEVWAKEQKLSFWR